MTIGWCFDNTYFKLPKAFKEDIKPIPVKKPELLLFNKELAEDLNLNFSNLLCRYWIFKFKNIGFPSEKDLINFITNSPQYRVKREIFLGSCLIKGEIWMILALSSSL